MTDKQIAEFTKTLNVLVVEDNQVDRRMLESMLKEPFQVSATLKTTDSLNSAIDLIQKNDFDVVILDLNLPDSHGEETLKELYKKFPKLPIVVNTGAYEDELGLQTLSLGAQDFLVKGKYSAYTLNKVLHYALERKRLELELKEAYVKLKETQSQLIQAEKMEVIGGLASGVAHEVKNPLATILYGANCLVNSIKTDDEKMRFVLENIQEAAERANVIITDLLDFSSLTKIQLQEENLNSIIEKSLQLIHHQFEKNNIEVIRELNLTIPEVKIDRNRIEQVLINLFLNAIYAMPKGGKLVVKSYSRKEGGIVGIDVEDNGVGIPENKLTKIFDPFFTTRRSEGGVGLGLAVSKNIMDLHEGMITIGNNKDGGVKVTLLLKI